MTEMKNECKELNRGTGSLPRCDNCKHGHEDENRYDQRWCSMWAENVECADVCKDHEPKAEKNSKH